jgi:hypothetical protein
VRQQLFTVFLKARDAGQKYSTTSTLNLVRLWVIHKNFGQIHLKGKRTLESPGHKWKNNNNRNFKGTVPVSVYRMHVAMGNEPLQGLSLKVLQNAMNCSRRCVG